MQTNDNTQGAVNEARQYLTKPYKRRGDGRGAEHTVDGLVAAVVSSLAPGPEGDQGGAPG